MDEKQFIPTLLLLSRLVAAIICVRRARILNRSQAAWGAFALIFPLIAVVIIYLMKYKETYRYSK